MPDADKYRILPEQTVYDEVEYAVWRVERDRLQAEYIAASEALIELLDDNWLSAWAEFEAARAALKQHMEDHP
jgi:hypothetical protein